MIDNISLGEENLRSEIAELMANWQPVVSTIFPEQQNNVVDDPLLLFEVESEFLSQQHEYLQEEKIVSDELDGEKEKTGLCCFSTVASWRFIFLQQTIYLP